MIRPWRSVFAFLGLGLAYASRVIGYILNPLTFRPINDIECWTPTIKVREGLKVSASVRQDFRSWTARAMNDRHLAGAACHGDLLGPACPALVG